MRSKLVRNLSTKRWRDFWAAVETSAATATKERVGLDIDVFLFDVWEY